MKLATFKEMVITDSQMSVVLIAKEVLLLTRKDTKILVVIGEKEKIFKGTLAVENE